MNREIGLTTQRIVITGAKGLLGSELCAWFRKDPRFPEIIPWDLPDFDITDHDRVREELGRIEPHMIIHLAAWTDVDGCEVDKTKAYLVNASATMNIVRAIQESNSTFVFISTDYVFDGKKGSPYTELDPPNPLNYYGLMKLHCEKYIRDGLKKFFIIRTAGLFGRQGKNFVDAILEQAQTRTTLFVVNDQITSPTYAKDLCPFIAKLISSEHYGTFHLANRGYCSWFEFARAIVEITGLKNEVLPITTALSGRRAQRPAFSALDCREFERVFKERPRHWRDALHDYLKDSG